MEARFQDLLNVQKTVNIEVTNRLKGNNLKEPKVIDYLIAMHVELFELINELGFWKWWKQSHKTNKERILDELADVVAFYLEILLLTEKAKEKDEWINDAISAFSDYDKQDILEYLSSSIETEKSKSHGELMAIAIVLVTKTLDDITWEDIEGAYMKKSEVNIQRQKDNY